MNPAAAQRRQQAERLMAVAAALSILALAFWMGQDRTRPHTVTGPYFAAGALQPDGLERLEIIQAGDSFALTRYEEAFQLDNGGAKIPAEEVRALLEILAAWQRDGMRTADPGKHERLNLVAPSEGGNALRLRAVDRDGVERFDVLIGADAPGRKAFYVRATASNQTVRVRGERPRVGRRADWIGLPSFTWEADDIVEVRVQATGAAFYTLRRAADGFTLLEPADHIIQDADMAFSIATTLSQLSFADIRPSADLLTAPIATHSARRADGLSVTLALFEERGGKWAVIAVAAQTERAGEAADALRETTQGRAFALSAFAYERLTRSLDQFAAPLDG